MTKKTLSKEETKKIAGLARLTLTSQEVDIFTPQLQETLKSVEVMSELKTDKTDGTFQVNALTNVFREDTVETSFTQKEALGNAVNTHNGFFVVPYVFENE